MRFAFFGILVYLAHRLSVYVSECVCVCVCARAHAYGCMGWGESEERGKEVEKIDNGEESK